MASLRGGALSVMLFILLSGSLAYAQTTREVLGRVSNRATGLPIVNATVTADGQSATTDQSGDYQLPQVPINLVVTLTASAQGFESVSRNITVSSTGAVPVQDFALSPITSGRVFGTITDASTSQPIGGATISIGTISAQSNSAGGYELTNVTAGNNLNVSASASGFQSAFQIISVEANGQVRVDLALLPIITTATIRGSIRNASDGSPLRGAQVAAASRSTSSGDSGDFTLSQLDPGEIVVRVSAPGFISHTENMNLRAGENVRLIVFLRQLVPASSIQGMVKNRANQGPISGALVSSGSISTRTDDRGSYALTNLAGRSATVSVQADSFEGENRTVELQPGGTMAVNFDLRPRSERLIILWAGFGYSPLTFTSDGGGSIAIEAELVGGRGDVSAEVLYQINSPFGIPIEMSLGEMSRQEGSYLYRLVLADIAPGSLPPGPNIIPGFSIRARDSSGQVAHFPALDVPGEAPLLAVEARNIEEPIRPFITMAGFGLSPLTFSAAEGGRITIQVHVLGGLEPLTVEAFFMGQDPFGAEINVPLGQLIDRDGDRVYELTLTGLRPGALRPGPNLITGFTIRATDARGRAATWPTLDVLRAPEEQLRGIDSTPRLPSEARNITRPMILMAGFGNSPALVSAESGGQIAIWAQVAGLSDGMIVEAMFDRTGLSSAIMADPDGDGVYQVIITSVQPGSLPQGPYAFPGFAIRVRDPSGRVMAYWPELEVPETAPPPR